MVNVNLLRHAEHAVSSEGRVIPAFLPSPCSVEDRFIVRSLQQVRESSPLALPAAVQNLKELIATLR